MLGAHHLRRASCSDQREERRRNRHLISGADGLITGQQIRAARTSLGWEPKALAIRAKVPLSVVLRAEGSPGEPVITIAQLNALMQAMRAAGASFPPVDPQKDNDKAQP